MTVEYQEKVDLIYTYKESFDEALTYLFNKYGVDAVISGISGEFFGFETQTCMFTDYDYVTDKHVNVEQYQLCMHRYILISDGTFCINPHSFSVCKLVEEKDGNGKSIISYTFCEEDLDMYVDEVIAFYENDWIRDIVKTAQMMQLNEQLSAGLTTNNESRKRVKV